MAGKGRRDGAPRRGSSDRKPPRPDSRAQGQSKPRSQPQRQPRAVEAAGDVRQAGAFVEVARVIDAPASAIFRMINDPAKREWAPERLYRVMSALPPRFARLAFPDGSQVAIAIVRQGNTRSSVSIEHGMLPAGADTEALRRRWTDALYALSDALDSDWG